MKRIMERLTAFLLTLVTLVTASSCTKKIVNADEDAFTSKKSIETTVDFPETTMAIEENTTEEELSCDCTTDFEPDNVSICLPETTTNKIKVTTSPTMSSTEAFFSTTTTVPNTQNYINQLSIVSSDPNFVISDELRSKIEKTIKKFNSTNVAFSLYDLNTGVTINYNNQEGFNGACIVKPGIVLYLLTLAEKGELDLNIKLKYPGNYSSGSGYLNGYYSGYQAYTGQEFTLLELMYHALYYSDNNAYRMLYKYIKDNEYFEGYTSLMHEAGADSLTVSTDSMWVRSAMADDGVHLILALNDFIESSRNGMNVDQKFVDGGNLAKASGHEYLTYGEILYWIMINGKYDYLENYTGITSLTKTGFVSGSGNLSCRNDISLCYADNPYALCLLTKYNDEDLRKSTVKSLLKYLNEVMNEYNKYCKESSRLILQQ